MIAKDILRNKMERNLTTVRLQLKIELERARASIERTLSGLQRGEELDEHLIHNMGGIALDIVKLNLLVRAIPYLEGDGEQATKEF